MGFYGHSKHLLFSVSSVVHIEGVYGYGWDYMVAGHSLHFVAIKRSTFGWRSGWRPQIDTPSSAFQRKSSRLLSKIVRLENAYK
jgi:hypothetical protein